MGMIRRAIVRAAPTCTLWEECFWGMCFRPAYWPQRWANRINNDWHWAPWGIRHRAGRFSRWLGETCIISRQELEDAQR